MTASFEHLVQADVDFVVRSTPLGGSRLSQLLQQRDPRVAGWLSSVPDSSSAWQQRAHQVHGSFAHRDWLTPLATAFAATGPAAQRLSRAAASGVVVTTGQQPGLFGGPAYTWSKAVSALAFSDELEALTGIPVAPVFWAATDDADWMEAAATYLVSSSGLEELRLDGKGSQAIAMSDVRLGETRHLLDKLRAASGSGANARALELVADSYVPHATIGAAYVQLLRGILEPLGIAVLDASHPAVRMAADPLLRRALSEAQPVASALSARTSELSAAGLSPQVETIDTLSLVFRTTIDRTSVGTRERVPVGSAMRAAREAERGTLGSNVLLRPVIERALLPTVAYHAGPGELAYFAQVAPVADALQADAPLAVPRWSGEVIERSALRALERLGLDEQSLASPSQAETRIAREALDEQTADAVERLRLAMETQVRALGESLARADQLVPAETVAGLQRDIERRIGRMERRILAATKKRESLLMRDLAVARAAIRPLGKSPERVLNFLPFLARHGNAVFDSMRQAARAHARTLLRGSADAS